MRNSTIGWKEKLKNKHIILCYICLYWIIAFIAAHTLSQWFVSIAFLIYIIIMANLYYYKILNKDFRNWLNQKIWQK